MNSMLSRVRAAAEQMVTSPEPAHARTAIIDIGSNSVRLVIYDGPRRIPFILFNEKVMAGLGASLARTGAIEPEAMERGLRAIGRFAHLCRSMKVADIRCVATAAVRDATNGGDFIARAKDMGLTVELLSGGQEAIGAAMGVLSGIPGADGIVGDLGGGSLELARVRGGAVEQTISLPLGVLRLPQIPARAGGACPGHRWPPAVSSAVRFARDASGSCGCNDRAPPGFPAGLVPGCCRRRAGSTRNQPEFIGHVLRFPGRLVRPAAGPACALVLRTYRPPAPGP